MNNWIVSTIFLIIGSNLSWAQDSVDKSKFVTLVFDWCVDDVESNSVSKNEIKDMKHVAI